MISNDYEDGLTNAGVREIVASGSLFFGGVGEDEEALTNDQDFHYIVSKVIKIHIYLNIGRELSSPYFPCAFQPW